MSARRCGVVAAGFTFAPQFAPRVLLPDPAGFLTTHLAQQGRDQGEGQGAPAAHGAPPDTRALQRSAGSLLGKAAAGGARCPVRSEQRGQGARLCRAGTTRTPFSWGPARIGPGRGFLDRVRRLRQLGTCEEQGSHGEIAPGAATFGFPSSLSIHEWVRVVCFLVFFLGVFAGKERERKGGVEKASR